MPRCLCATGKLQPDKLLVAVKASGLEPTPSLQLQLADVLWCVLVTPAGRPEAGWVWRAGSWRRTRPPRAPTASAPPRFLLAASLPAPRQRPAQCDVACLKVCVAGGDPGGWRRRERRPQEPDGGRGAGLHQRAAGGSCLHLLPCMYNPRVMVLGKCMQCKQKSRASAETVSPVLLENCACRPRQLIGRRWRGPHAASCNRRQPEQ
jgi:hypothetical protein